MVRLLCYIVAQYMFFEVAKYCIWTMAVAMVTMVAMVAIERA